MKLLDETSIFNFLLILTVPPLVIGAPERERLPGPVGERINGGEIPPEGKYPSLARIEYFYKREEWAAWGTASIINRDWLLTNAGTLCRNYNKVVNASRLRIIVGDSIINETEPYEQTVYVERFIIHEKFHGGNWAYSRQTAYDVAVIKVTPSIKFSNRVTAVNLPVCNDFQLGTAWIASWGARYPSKNESVRNYRLTEIDIPIIALDECNERLKTQGNAKLQVTDLTLCTLEGGIKGVCFLDWGAPLFLIKNESYMVQVGIFSFVPKQPSKCGTENRVDIFTRVSRYLGWIHRRISSCGNHRFHNITKVSEFEY